MLKHVCLKLWCSDWEKDIFIAVYAYKTAGNQTQKQDMNMHLFFVLLCLSYIVFFLKNYKIKHMKV